VRGVLGNLRKGYGKKVADIPGDMTGDKQFRGIITISYSRAYVPHSDEEHGISTSLNVEVTG